MNVYFKPSSVIVSKLGLQDGGYWHKEFANSCMRHMERFVPKDSGVLRRSAYVSGTDITYPMPYAKYQYYGQREDGSHVVKQWTEPGTGPYWDKRMVSADMKKIEKEIEGRMRGK